MKLSKSSNAIDWQSPPEDPFVVAVRREAAGENKMQISQWIKLHPGHTLVRDLKDQGDGSNVAVVFSQPIKIPEDPDPELRRLKTDQSAFSVLSWLGPAPVPGAGQLLKKFTRTARDFRNYERDVHLRRVMDDFDGVLGHGSYEENLVKLGVFISKCLVAVAVEFAQDRAVFEPTSVGINILKQGYWCFTSHQLPIHELHRLVDKRKSVGSVIRHHREYNEKRVIERDDDALNESVMLEVYRWILRDALQRVAETIGIDFDTETYEISW